MWVLLAVVFSVVGCGSDIDASEEYGDDNREAFLASCTAPGDDDRVVRDVCECTYERIEAELAYAEFVALEESLRLDALAPLPEPVAALMAECFTEVADL